MSIKDFLQKYGLVDDGLPTYDEHTKQTIVNILNDKKNIHVDSDNKIVLLYTGLKYKYVINDVEKAKEYYLRGVKQKCPAAMNNLAFIYEQQNEIELAENYYLMATEHNHYVAMTNVGILYKLQRKFGHAEKFYRMAIEYHHSKAMLGLAILYRSQGNAELAETYYVMAVKYECPKAMTHLGDFYMEQNKFGLAVECYLKSMLSDEKAIETIVRIYIKLSDDLQLEIFELCPQVREMDKQFKPNYAREIYTNKKTESQKCLTHLLPNDIVTICSSYY